jgi:hypothetical protein
MKSVIIAIIAFVLGAAAMTLKPAKKVEAPKVEPRDEQFWTITNAVSMRLLAPATARFEPMEKIYIKDGVAHGRVHSENLNGALLEHSYELDLSRVKNGMPEYSAVVFTREKWGNVQESERIWK